MYKLTRTCSLSRGAIAQNPNTDFDIRYQLTQDPNIIVRAAARDILGASIKRSLPN